MRVLITVASRHGATQEIGEWAATTLRARGHDVDVRDPAEVEDVTGYDAVVVGSAVYVGHWLAPARDLLARHADDLRARPVWLFSSGLSTQPSAASNSPHELGRAIELVRARGHRSFRGRLDREVLSFAERATIAGARAREGDHRDVDAVRRWADEVADALDGVRTSLVAG
ncbi:flavodoxin domain-containing protein [Cellulomonas sp. HZM]|uniref:flavodoxin domain-containing protein n=1 Tax=Cellulomonas sp. HZM TaxID=1454010 RepID=UPI00049369D7|nr:flavodoxin domain-containing protein [Cellulomonas sp. HZM]